MTLTLPIRRSQANPWSLLASNGELAFLSMSVQCTFHLSRPLRSILTLHRHRDYTGQHFVHMALCQAHSIPWENVVFPFSFLLQRVIPQKEGEQMSLLPGGDNH